MRGRRHAFHPGVREDRRVERRRLLGFLRVPEECEDLLLAFRRHGFLLVVFAEPIMPRIDAGAERHRAVTSGCCYPWRFGPIWSILRLGLGGQPGLYGRGGAAG